MVENNAAEECVGDTRACVNASAEMFLTEGEFV